MFKYVLFLVIVAMSMSNPTQCNMVEMSLYYESLCPYCTKFIREQIQPVYADAELEPFLKLTLIPFGNARHYKLNNKWVSECQHLSIECHRNKLQACALQMEKANNTGVKFCICFESKDNTESNEYENVKKCADENSFKAEDLYACATSEQGDLYFEVYGNLTKNRSPALTYVPSIWFNNKPNRTLEDNARDNLTATVCNLLRNQQTNTETNKLPNVCSPSSHL